MQAPKHPFETARLNALRRYNILDTPRESDFDDLVLLASQICKTPIAVVNLIDADRQWFKAETGLGVRETPLETSLCSHVILEQDFVEIPDTRADPRMCDNPLCIDEPGLRFYAGALLKSAEGLPIGTLCVLDNEPRSLDDYQRSAVRTLAAQVVTQLELRATIAQQVVLRHEIDHRVKNSLQSVNAFVMLEQTTSQHPETRAVLGNVAQHIATVSLLHEQLSHVAADVIDLGAFLDRIAALLDRATPGIRVTGRFDSLPIDCQYAAVIGTIFNELVANAVKHAAFGDDATIRIEGNLHDGLHYRLTCKDNGTPKPKVASPDARVGLGLAIIEASVGQLGGTLVTTIDDTGYQTMIELDLSSPKFSPAAATGTAHVISAD